MTCVYMQWQLKYLQPTYDITLSSGVRRWCPVLLSLLGDLDTTLEVSLCTLALE